jgi:hypothetical protein
MAAAAEGLRRRTDPITPKPRSSMAQLAGSGTKAINLEP